MSQSLHLNESQKRRGHSAPLVTHCIVLSPLFVTLFKPSRCPVRVRDLVASTDHPIFPPGTRLLTCWSRGFDHNQHSRISRTLVEQRLPVIHVSNGGLATLFGKIMSASVRVRTYVFRPTGVTCNTRPPRRGDILVQKNISEDDVGVTARTQWIAV